MASELNSESRRLYSWWWDSHISPKNSKWLQENLTDLDAKVKEMIKLIEEDADSFAKRAEMYYKKRPELMKLVEEFYRAYRALAERYDYATGELRHAQRTMAAAFANQLPFVLTEDSPSGSSALGTEPRTPEMPHPIHAFLDPDDLHAFQKCGSFAGESDFRFREKSLKELHKMLDGVLDKEKVIEGQSYDMDSKNNSFHKNIAQLSSENQNLKAKVLSESDRADKAECEVKNLTKALSDMNAEKEAVHIEYQQSLEKLSDVDRELNSALKDSRRLDEQARKAETEVLMLKEALIMLQAEKDAFLTKQKEYSEAISDLEGVVSHTKEEAKKVEKRAVEAENDAEYLRNKLHRLESKKETVPLEYKLCLDKISDLETKIAVAEEDAKLLREKADIAEIEVQKLRSDLSEMREQKETLRRLYDHCLKKISKLESDLSSAQEDVRRLNDELFIGATKLKNSEEMCVQLKMSNQSLQQEADDLGKKIASKDQELSQKHEELDKLQICVKDEHSRYIQVEASLQTLQKLHAQSQEEQRALSSELKDGLHMLKDLEASKHGLEEEVQQVKDENQNLNELNSSYIVSIKNLDDEILSLRKMKVKLEEEVSLQLGQSNALQQEISSLQEDIKGLNKSYQALMSQVEFVGLNPESLGSSVKDLQDENSKLREVSEKDKDEREALLQKIESMNELIESNAALKISMSDVDGELEESRKKVKELQDSCQFHHGEKAELILEKALLLSQLQNITENMKKLVEKNTFLENSLTSANAELAGLREKSKGLEELCQLLKSEKSDLVAERTELAVKLENVEQRLETLEKRFSNLEANYGGMEKEKDLTHCQVQELRVCLSAEKQERETFRVWNKTKLADLETHIHHLQEDSKWRRKEFQEELDKAVIAQFEVFILQKFIEDLEERNYSLLVECEKHIEASKLADKLISELESENLEQQVEEELLLVEIEKLRLGIYKVFKALETESESGSEDITENEQISIHDILGNIEDMKSSLLKCDDDRQQLAVENSVIMTLLQQLNLKVHEMELDKHTLDNLYEIMKKDLMMLEDEKLAFVKMNKQLRSEVSKGDDMTVKLKGEVESLCAKQSELQRAYLELEEDYYHSLKENSSLLKELSDVKEEKCVIEEENNDVLLENLALSNLCTVLKSFGTGKAAEVQSLYEDLENLRGFNTDLEKELIFLREKLEKKEMENFLLQDSIEILEMKLSGVQDSNAQLKLEISIAKQIANQKEKEKSEAEEKLNEMENTNSELCLVLDGLKRKYEESEAIRETSEKRTIRLSEDSANLNKEIKCLHEVNGKLLSDLDMLHGEIEERRIIEEKLTSELQEKENEFELWEAEAMTFYFDLQISNIREVLFEDKIHELTGACQSFASEASSKNLEIEQMKEKVSFMESEIDGLRGQLLSYTPIISSLKENIASLEHNSLSLTKLIEAGNQRPKDVEVAVHLSKTCSEGPSEYLNNGLSELKELHTRIVAVEKIVVEDINKLAMQDSTSTKVKLGSLKREAKDFRPGRSSRQEKEFKKERRGLGNEILLKHNLNSKAKQEASEMKKGILMKDIPLDQVSDGSLSGIDRRGSVRADDHMIELWETAEEDRKLYQTGNKLKRQPYEPTSDDVEMFEVRSFEPQMERELSVDKLQVPMSINVADQGRNKGKILQKLASDAKKLTSMKTTVQDLKKTLQTRRKSKKPAGVDYETVKEQLEEVEENVLQLVDLNSRMTGSIEKSPSSGEMALAEEAEALDIRRERISEQAHNGSENIGRLQLEVQKIHYVLLNLEDEKKAKSRFARTKSRTSVILRDFIHCGKRSSSRRKKGRLCGCLRPSTRGDSSRT